MQKSNNSQTLYIAGCRIWRISQLDFAHSMLRELKGTYLELFNTRETTVLLIKNGVKNCTLNSQQIPGL